ncbi:MAG: hypothetical protein HOM58_12085 [Rhodospirillaceae bacterium]|jgi:hypothetical protein|nr:hypothetical protein [Rhodospirillaceae bacterium]MBT5459201.1 hypothetical protein [Rhodospirillaceae bacterium]
MKRVVACACCVLVVILTGCKRGPVLKQDDEQIQIVEVQVTTHKRFKGTVNMAEAVRYQTQNAAYRFSQEGSEKILKVLLRILKISDAGTAFMWSGSSSIRVTARLVDKKTGKIEKKYKARARVFRLAGVVGAVWVIAEGVSHVRDEKRLARLLSNRLMTRIYGQEYGARVKDRVPTREVKPIYPMSWEDAGKKFQCEQIEAEIKEPPQEVNASEYQPFTPQELPAYCSKYLKSGS